MLLLPRLMEFSGDKNRRQVWAKQVANAISKARGTGVCRPAARGLNLNGGFAATLLMLPVAPLMTGDWRAVLMNGDCGQRRPRRRLCSRRAEMVRHSVAAVAGRNVGKTHPCALFTLYCNCALTCAADRGAVISGSYSAAGAWLACCDRLKT